MISSSTFKLAINYKASTITITLILHFFNLTTKNSVLHNNSFFWALFFRPDVVAALRNVNGDDLPLLPLRQPPEAPPDALLLPVPPVLIQNIL